MQPTSLMLARKKTRPDILFGFVQLFAAPFPGKAWDLGLEMCSVKFHGGSDQIRTDENSSIGCRNLFQMATVSNRC